MFLNNRSIPCRATSYFMTFYFSRASIYTYIGKDDCLHTDSKPLSDILRHNYPTSIRQTSTTIFEMKQSSALREILFFSVSNVDSTHFSHLGKQISWGMTLTFGCRVCVSRHLYYMCTMQSLHIMIQATHKIRPE